MRIHWKQGQTKMRRTPTTIGGGNRRNAVPYNSRVLLVSPEGGEIREGELQIPKSMTTDDLHSNKWLIQEKFVETHLKDYEEWLTAKGYKRESDWFVDGPWPLPQGKQVHKNLSHAITNDDGKADEIVWFRVRAKWRLMTPMYISFEDYAEQKRLGERHGVDIDDFKATLKPENELPEGVDFIDEPEGGIDPLKEREESWAARGIKREEYVAPSIEDWHR